MYFSSSFYFYVTLTFTFLFYYYLHSLHYTVFSLTFSHSFLLSTFFFFFFCFLSFSFHFCTLLHLINFFFSFFLYLPHPLRSIVPLTFTFIYLCLPSILQSSFSSPLFFFLISLSTFITLFHIFLVIVSHFPLLSIYLYLPSLS